MAPSNYYSDNQRIHQLIERVVGELKQFTEEQARNINDLVAIGRALSAERDLDKILEMILGQARRFTNADGGTLYMISEDGKQLNFHVVHNDTLNVYQGGTSGNKVELPSVPLYNPNGSPNHANVSAYVGLSGKVVNIDDVYEAKGFNFEGTKKFDAGLKYRSMSMLVVPMRDHEGEIIGVLQLINAKDQTTGETIPFARELEGMTHALASQAAVALTQQRLINDLKNLFESFIQAIATAIDEKSRYTGGHIARVTELTMMIAEEINRQREGAFGDFKFTDDELEELRIATWLHDTGKITTPEYVVDKSNKLETVFDRIELVKTRWQAIRLERQLRAATSLLDRVRDRVDPREWNDIEAKLDDELKVLDEELEFLDQTNRGGEFMADEKIERLESIAKRNYQENSSEHPFLTENEVYNLSIRKGTLTDEEREIMNNHVVMSIKILDELPWPRKLAHVPEIAGAHHEKLDGSGYPNGLKGDEINLQARIMAVADVFEALSARDRPYKKPMPLSQAIKILGFMVKDNHLDGRVVDLFIKSGLVFDYANRHLDPQQVDVTAEDSDSSKAG